MIFLNITEVQKEQIAAHIKFYDNFIYRCGYCKETIKFEEFKLDDFRWVRLITSSIVETGIEYTFCTQGCLDLFCILKDSYVHK